MKRFVLGLVVGFALVKGTEPCLASLRSALAKPELPRPTQVWTPEHGQRLQGWLLAVDVKGKGFACADPIVDAEKKVFACNDGYRIGDYKDGKYRGRN